MTSLTRHALVAFAFLSFLNLITLVTSLSHQVELLVSTERSSEYALEDLIMAYSIIDPQVVVTQASVASSEMYSRILDQELDMGLTVTSMPPAIAVAAPQLRMIPFVLTGLVPFYRLDSLGASSAKLILSRSVITRIFTANITKWNDRAIADLNVGVILPDQNITMILESSPASRFTIIKRALSKFDSEEFARSNMTVSSVSDFPYNKYANYFNVIPSTTALVAGVLARDGSFSIGFNAVVEELGASRASVQISQFLCSRHNVRMNRQAHMFHLFFSFYSDIINKAGNVVRISPSSLTLAATEMSNNLESGSNTAADLTDPSNEGAYPLALYSYAVIDALNTRGTCRSKKNLG